DDATTWLLRHRIVTDPNSVFSVTPAVQAMRPNTNDGPPGLFVAGDWVQTGWPATMEGAVISGIQAAAATAEFLGVQHDHLPRVSSGLKRGTLANWLLR
ncbi:MAG: FAD-dependent oxidoreductase, partial [Planctomycetota bacterium]